jgi:hypothetical protein
MYFIPFIVALSGDSPGKKSDKIAKTTTKII